MKDKKDLIQQFLSSLDIESVVVNELNKAKITTENLESPAIKHENMKESYVAQRKQFKQVSEFVSEKTKQAHIQLYADYIDSLNSVSAELDTADKVNTNSRHDKFRSLKLDETFNLNAVWLHELYFANCFDPHSDIYMDSSSYITLEREWGTFEDWQSEFIACAMACGNGWAVCGFNIFLKKFVNATISNHSQDVQVGFYPVLVVDMHEHAYARDYGSDKKSYIVAMLKQINWEIVEERVNKAKALMEVFK
jgi:Fe-Mn family superoxide dismutase